MNRKVLARLGDVCDECFTDISESRKEIEQYLEANNLWC